MLSLKREEGRRQNGRDPAGPLALVEQFIELLELDAVHESDPSAQAFCHRAQDLHRQIRTGAAAEALGPTGSACVEACRQFLTTRRALQTEREAGYRSMLQVLTEGLSTVAADAGSFTARLTTASERMGALAELNDIHELKKSLIEQVSEIKRVVVEKQQHDQALQAELSRRVAKLETSLVKTQVAASLDSLTQIAHRGQFDATLARWVELGRGSGDPFVLILIDTDQFKAINDTHGHPAGDAVLVGLAQTLTRLIRPCDLAARYGGDEFALLLARMSLDQAEKRAQQIVSHVAQTTVPFDSPEGRLSLQLTISAGAAQFGRGDTAEALLARADEALYAAKQQGRNRAMVKRTSFWPGRRP